MASTKDLEPNKVTRIFLNVGDQIQVYVDPKNYKHYYVCFEELEEMFSQIEAGDIK